MKRVLVYSTQYMANGGIESHLMEFCQRMTDAGVEMDLVVLNSAMLPDTETFFKRKCRKIYLSKHGRSSFRAAYLVYVGLSLLFRRYNALYTNGQGDSIQLVSNLIIRRKIWVHHHHTSGDAEDQRHWSKSYLKALLSADQVIACSSKNAIMMADFLKRSIKSIPCFSRRIKVLPQPEKSAKIRFGYYGRLIPEKGIDILCQLSADEDLVNIEFHIWGKGEAYNESFFNRYNNIFYHGIYSGYEELSKVVSSLDAFVLISTHAEGLPISLLEAMSAGLPWIATNRGGVADIACDPVSTRIIPAKPTYPQVKRSVEALASDIISGRISKQKQIDLYKRKFSSEALVAEWSSAFEL